MVNKTNSPTIAYLAFAFSKNPTVMTQKAHLLALKIMEKRPDWFVLVPHFAVDAMLDGVVDWKKDYCFDENRRMIGGLMSLAFLSNAHILILGIEPKYEYSSGVTWENIFVHLLNKSWRKNNPIQIVRVKDIIGECEYKKIIGDEFE